MKKKLKLSFTFVALFIVLCSTMSCANSYNISYANTSSKIIQYDVNKEVSYIEICNDEAYKDSYVVGEKISLKNLYVNVVYFDGNTSKVNVNQDMFNETDFDTSTFESKITPLTQGDESDEFLPNNKQTTVMFINNLDGLINKTQLRVINSGEKISSIKIPTPQQPSLDYKFDGWYRDEFFVLPLSLDDIISTNKQNSTYYYAKWNKIDKTNIAPDFIERNMTINLNNEQCLYQYKVYKDIGDWRFGFELDKNYKGGVAENVDTIYEVGDSFSNRNLKMIGIDDKKEATWGLFVSNGMVDNFDTSKVGRQTVKVSFASRTFSFEIKVIEPTSFNDAGIVISNEGVVENILSNSFRIEFPNNAYIVNQDLSASINENVRNNIREIKLNDTLTTVNDNSFANMQKLNTVHFGKGILMIGSNVFKNCYSLKSIYIDADEIPYLKDAENFLNSCPNCTIYVPKDILDDYTSAKGWCNYINRIEKI